MSIQTTAELVRMAHREGMEHAARIVDRVANSIMKRAEKAHADDDYDLYEALEGDATTLTAIAARIIRVSRRSRQ